jgi:periplasmic divalent cation tolerance protein
MTDKIAVLTTCESRLDAEKIANALVDARLAACVNILPMSSIYRWKGKVERAEELLLLIKSRRPLFDKLRAAVERIHPYEVPELIALPVADGLGAYLDWIEKETKADESTDPRAQ